MRKTMLAAVTAAIVAAAGAFMADRAEAMTMPAPAGLSGAAEALGGNVEQVRYVCRRWWNGYRWRSRCFWRPGGYYRPYRGYYRPYRGYRRGYY